MKKQKARILIDFYEDKDKDKCLTLTILLFRRDKYSRLYESLREDLKRKKLHSNGWNKTLIHIQKTHNKMRALEEVLQELDHIENRKEENKTKPLREIFFISKGKSDYARSCKKKIKYRERSSKKAAIEVSENISEHLESYKCRYCDGWHIGHSIL